jgi:hypothetical protein
MKVHRIDASVAAEEQSLYVIMAARISARIKTLIRAGSLMKCGGDGRLSSRCSWRRRRASFSVRLLCVCVVAGDTPR